MPFKKPKNDTCNYATVRHLADSGDETSHALAHRRWVAGCGVLKAQD